VLERRKLAHFPVFSLPPSAAIRNYE